MYILYIFDNLMSQILSQKENNIKIIYIKVEEWKKFMRNSRFVIPIDIAAVEAEAESVLVRVCRS